MIADVDGDVFRSRGSAQSEDPLSKLLFPIRPVGGDPATADFADQLAGAWVGARLCYAPFRCDHLQGGARRAVVPHR